MTGAQTLSGSPNLEANDAQPAGFRGRWLAFRNRLIADPKFQRWAARFPLTRPVAERRARQLFDLCAGFAYSQVLYACQTFDLFDQLAQAPASIDEIVDRTGLPKASADKLIRAAQSLDLLEPDGDGRYTLGQLGAAMVGNPAIGKMVEHHARLYADLADPAALLTGQKQETALGEFWGYGGYARGPASGGAEGPDYSNLMSASQSFIAEDVLAAYDFSRHACMLDLGGGDGTFIRAVAGHHSHLKFQLYDLPAVAQQAHQNLRAAGLDGRIRTFGGNFFTRDLPTGADLATLVRVVHDHDDADVLRLFGNVRNALPPGGRLLIAEPMARQQADPIMDAYFGFYFLAMGSGQTRTESTLRGLLQKSGFGNVKPLPTSRPMFCGLITADRQD